MEQISNKFHQQAIIAFEQFFCQVSIYVYHWHRSLATGLRKQFQFLNIVLNNETEAFLKRYSK